MHGLRNVIGNDDRLDSWKAIAEYLGRDRTTVMRWARTAGLPVRRVHGGRSVFAYKSELDRWFAEPGAADLSAGAAPARPDALPGAVAAPRRTSMWMALAVTASLITIAGGIWWWASAIPPIETAVLVGREIVATDAAGREVWRYRLPRTDVTVAPARIVVRDIDGDARADVVAALHFTEHGRNSYGTLLALDGRGRFRWEHRLEDRYRFGDEEFAPAWYPEDLLVYDVEGAARIAVTQHHHTWWPSVVVIYDGGGRPVDRFVHAGWLRNLAMTPDGRYLLAAGISNGFGGAALAVLDPAHPGGTAPAEGGALPACSNCPAGSPLAYFVAPWSDLAEPSDTPEVVVKVQPDGSIEWHANQRRGEIGKAPVVIVELSPSLEIRRSSVNNYFTEIHAALERAGTLGAAWQGRRPPVREWTPARGWRDLVED